MYVYNNFLEKHLKEKNFYWRIALHISLFFWFKTWVIPEILYRITNSFLSFFFASGMSTFLVILWVITPSGWLSIMHMAVLEEKSIFDAKLIWGCWESVIWTDDFAIGDSRVSDVKSAMPMLKKMNYN